MKIDTMAGMPIDTEVLQNYFRTLVNRFFKILPIREQAETLSDGESISTNEEAEEALITYMRSLQAELLGCRELVNAIQKDASYLTLISILQYLIDHPKSTVKEVRREVFRAISICNKLKAEYACNSEVVR